MAGYFDALEINPHNWRALYNAGNLFCTIGEKSLGVRYLIKSIEYNLQFIDGIIAFGVDGLAAVCGR